MTKFALHSGLDADTAFVADWPLCRVLLMNDARYPWVILVPRRADAVEIMDLTLADRSVLMEEIARASRIVRGLPGVIKLNIGALGNVVPQLHVHVLGRRDGDPAGRERLEEVLQATRRPPGSRPGSSSPRSSIVVDLSAST